MCVPCACAMMMKIEGKFCCVIHEWKGHRKASKHNAEGEREEKTKLPVASLRVCLLYSLLGGER
jgi:hypothetical protein